jgi:hypothetical protein
MLAKLIAPLFPAFSAKMTNLPSHMVGRSVALFSCEVFSTEGWLKVLLDWLFYLIWPATLRSREKKGPAKHANKRERVSILLLQLFVGSYKNVRVDYS